MVTRRAAGRVAKRFQTCPAKLTTGHERGGISGVASGNWNLWLNSQLFVDQVVMKKLRATGTKIATRTVVRPVFCHLVVTALKRLRLPGAGRIRATIFALI